MCGSYVEENALSIEGYKRYFYEVSYVLGYKDHSKAARHYGVSVEELVAIEQGYERLPDRIRQQVISEAKGKHWPRVAR